MLAVVIHTRGGAPLRSVVPLFDSLSCHFASFLQWISVCDPRRWGTGYSLSLGVCLWLCVVINCSSKHTRSCFIHVRKIDLKLFRRAKAAKRASKYSMAGDLLIPPGTYPQLVSSFVVVIRGVGEEG